MKKSLIRNMYLLAILLWGVGAVLNGLAFHALALPLASVGIILFVISWISSLVKTAQLAHWIWFVCLLIFSIPTLLLYIFWGPTTSTHLS